MEVNQVKGERTVRSEDSTCKGPVVGSYGDCEADRGALWVEQREPREGGGGPSRRILPFIP